MDEGVPCFPKSFVLLERILVEAFKEEERKLVGELDVTNTRV